MPNKLDLSDMRYLVGQPDLVVCDDCDAVHRRVAVRLGEVAYCERCNKVLGRSHSISIEGLLALAVGALVLFFMSNLFPIVTLELRGSRIDATLPDAIVHTWKAGQAIAAILAGATALTFPLSLILLRLYILVPLTQGRVPWGFVTAMHTLRRVTYWSMVEVFMLGTLIAMVRSTIVATVIPGPGLFSYAALTLILTSLTAAGHRRLWQVSSKLKAP